MCIKRLIIAKKGCGQLTSNDTYFSDSWFSGVKTFEKALAEVVDYCRLVKTINKGFSCYISKIDEILDGRAISYSEEYYNISW